MRLRITRPPDIIIGPHHAPYMHRWYILPRNRWFNIYLHKFLNDDDDRALHDHPWPSVSFLLSGNYVEYTPSNMRRYRAGSVVFRRASHAHRIELPGGQPCWTLFITGPVVREWGFHCPKGWRHWKEFVDDRDRGQVGRGCD